MVTTILLLSLLSGALCVPPPTPDQIKDYEPLKGRAIDPTYNVHLKAYPKHGGEPRDHNFKYVHVNQKGDQFPNTATGLLEISATETVDKTTLDTALRIVYLQCRNMPSRVWESLAKNAAVGVFTMAEGTTIFPEYLQYRDRPECKGTCAGRCSNTCTGDGRKYDSLAGLGGRRGTCVNDNIMCNSDDPYYGQSNILVHEFAHTIHGYALDYNRQREIYNAWIAARNARTWKVNSYAMSTDYEYFAEAAGVFFHANNYLLANGGMSDCFNKGYCDDQEDARAWLEFKDPKLFSLLSYTFTNYKPELKGDLARCVKI